MGSGWGSPHPTDRFSQRHFASD